MSDRDEPCVKIRLDKESENRLDDAVRRLSQSMRSQWARVDEDAFLAHIFRIGLDAWEKERPR